MKKKQQIHFDVPAQYEDHTASDPIYISTENKNTIHFALNVSKLLVIWNTKRPQVGRLKLRLQEDTQDDKTDTNI